MSDQAMPLVPGPNDIPMTEATRLLNTSPTSITRLVGGHLLEAKRFAIGGGRGRLYFDRDQVIELARTWKPSAAHIRNTKAIDRRASESLSHAVAEADGRARTPPPKAKAKAKAKAKRKQPKPKLRAALMRSAPAPAPCVDEGKRLINALATIQELYGKTDADVGASNWAELRAWARR